MHHFLENIVAMHSCVAFVDPKTLPPIFCSSSGGQLTKAVGKGKFQTDNVYMFVPNLIGKCLLCHGQHHILLPICRDICLIVFVLETC